MLFMFVLAASNKNGAGPAPVTGYSDGFMTIPDTIPEPVIWYSPRFVEVDGGGTVTKMLNQGNLGAVKDAVPATATAITIDETNLDWAEKKVFAMPSASTGGFNFETFAVARTIVAIATYRDSPVKFGDYDGLVSGPVGGTNSEHQLVAQTNTARFTEVSGQTIYKDAVDTSDGTVLPMTKAVIASTYTGSTPAVGTLFYDNFSVGRNWWGTVGDILIFDQILTPEQITEITNVITAYFAPIIPDEVQINTARSSVLFGAPQSGVYARSAYSQAIFGNRTSGVTARRTTHNVIVRT